MALGRTRGRMRNAAMQRASQQQAMQQRAAAQRSGLRAMPQRPAAMPKQVAGGIEAAFNAAQNKNTQGSFMDYAAQRAMQQFNQAPAATRAPAQQAQQSPNLVAAVNAAQQKAMQQFNQVPVTQQLAKQQATTQERRTVPQQAAFLPKAPLEPPTAPAKQATYKQPTMSQADVFNQSADINKQLGALEAEAQKARANAPKMPAMRKGGAVKKKPGYAKGGMVMANCGASMKPQQQRKK
jgi:hypothetical protein